MAMTSFLLLPGAGGDPWYWHLVVGELVRQGHQATAVDLPADDETADLDRYTDIAVAAAAGMEDIVVVAQSLGAFTAPLVANRLPVASVALVNPMIPLPGETPGDWWSRSGYDQAQGSPAADPDVFTHDLPPAVAAALAGPQRNQSATVFASPCRYDSWPAVPIHVLVGAILLAIALLRTLRGHYSPQKYMGVELSGIYWHFVDVVWVVLYTLVYLLSNGARAPL